MTFTPEQDRWLTALSAGRYTDLRLTGWTDRPIELWVRQDGAIAHSALGVALAELAPENRALQQHPIKWRPYPWQDDAETSYRESRQIHLPRAFCDRLGTHKRLFLRGYLPLHPEAPPLQNARSILMATYHGATHTEVADYLRTHPWALFANFDAPAKAA